MDGDTARTLFKDLTHAMSNHAHSKYDFRFDGEKSPMQAEYGDTWSFIYGIHRGVTLKRGDTRDDLDLNPVTGDVNFKKGNVNPDGGEWEEHYEEFGYGIYGRALKIGRRLAFWENRDFTFVE